MLGLGRGKRLATGQRDVGRLDLAALERKLAQSREPAILIANAGEVNAGGFDPIAEVAEVAERHQAWMHCLPPRIHIRTLALCRPRTRAVLERSPSGRPCGPMDAAATEKWWSDTWLWPVV